MAGGGSWISAAEQRRAPPFSRLKAANHLLGAIIVRGLAGSGHQHAIDVLFFETREGHFCKGLRD